MAFLFVLFLSGTSDCIDFSSSTSLLRDLVAHLCFMQNYLDHNPNGPTWSLAVEEHFYLLLSLLLIALKKCADKYKKTGLI